MSENEEEVVLDANQSEESNEKSKRKKTNKGGKRGRKKVKEEEEMGHPLSSFEGEDDDLNNHDGNTPKDKRALRLAKNREAAHQFRQRQKQYLSELESKVSELTNENAHNKATLELLRSENQLIREQLNYLRTFISQAVSFSSTFSQSGTISIPPGLAAGLQAAGDILSTPPILPNRPKESSDNETDSKNKKSPNE
eukprot:TRINITY_DN22_c1_g1_i1.p1 TRINITY_DN22_c1_g1~~TRINITY_DN22_c1_g1_i1.p1  ORF type:complete len:196 (+),score=86.83 TRINITY_DN22_c1_g1_i1:882-1469(+)